MIETATVTGSAAAREADLAHEPPADRALDHRALGAAKLIAAAHVVAGGRGRRALR
ncbi:MAG: hypothetical protein ACK5AZ_26615 [Bryobacteraceae bacterium]